MEHRSLNILCYTCVLAGRRTDYMIGKNKERWRELCELAEKEQDPDKLIALIKEINRLLEEKQSRLTHEPIK
jgi:hypothetical protein